MRKLYSRYSGITVAVAIVGLTIFASACSDSSGPESITGTYTLRTVNGMALPYLVATETSGGVTSKVEVVDGSATLNENKGYTSSITARQTVGSSVNTTVSTSMGTYAVNGTAITFTAADGVISAGTLTGGTLTGLVGNLPLVFSK